MSEENSLEAIKSERDYYLKVIADAQNVLADWIVPSSTMNNADALDRLTGILDNRELVLKMWGLTEPEALFTQEEFKYLLDNFNHTVGTSPSGETRTFVINLREKVAKIQKWSKTLFANNEEEPDYGEVDDIESAEGWGQEQGTFDTAESLRHVLGLPSCSKPEKD